MGLINTTDLFTGFRSRLAFSRSKMADKLDIEETTLWRITSRNSTPQAKTIKALTNLFLLAQDKTIILPYLEDQPMEAFKLCYELIHAIDAEDQQSAEELIKTLVAFRGFDRSVNKQFILSQGARLDLQRNGNTSEIRKKIHEGLGITNISESDFWGKVLILQEPELLHTLALVYASEGNISHAIKIMEEVIGSLNQSPIDEETVQ